jgi:hypothetical protein
MEDVKSPPHTNFSAKEYSGQRQPLVQKIKISLDPTKNCCPPARLQKNHCPCILKGHLSTNLHLQGPKSNIHVSLPLSK